MKWGALLKMGAFSISEGILIKGRVKPDVWGKGGPGCVETVFVLAGGSSRKRFFVQKFKWNHQTINKKNAIYILPVRKARHFLSIYFIHNFILLM